MYDKGELVFDERSDKMVRKQPLHGQERNVCFSDIRPVYSAGFTFREKAFGYARAVWINNLRDGSDLFDV